MKCHLSMNLTLKQKKKISYVPLSNYYCPTDPSNNFFSGEFFLILPWRKLQNVKEDEVRQAIMSHHICYQLERALRKQDTTSVLYWRANSTTQRHHIPDAVSVHLETNQMQRTQLWLLLT